MNEKVSKSTTNELSMYVHTYNTSPFTSWTKYLLQVWYSDMYIPCCSFQMGSQQATLSNWYINIHPLSSWTQAREIWQEDHGSFILNGYTSALHLTESKLQRLTPSFVLRTTFCYSMQQPYFHLLAPFYGHWDSFRLKLTAKRICN